MRNATMTENVTYNFTGRVALVTGAAMGMGYAAAAAFAKAGAKVVLVDVKADAVQTAADTLHKETGAEVLALTCDVSDEDQVREMIEATVARFGRLDAAYNNAGIQAEGKNMHELSSETYDWVQGINLRGVWLCMKYELAQMVKQGSGAIVNCSSNAGLVGVPGRTPYVAAKHGILGMTKAATLEYAAQGIRINAVCPGIIHTPMVAAMLEQEADAMDALMPMVPAKRLGSADEVAQAVLWLCSDASSFVMGHALAVDGAYTVQ